ncbi:MAG TPA: hypothetical protein VK428_10640 [Acidimicrobiales bacterium]|nr:hypothetical protein [Acidimicrobiales bacterium]
MGEHLLRLRLFDHFDVAGGGAVPGSNAVPADDDLPGSAALASGPALIGAARAGE